MQDIGAIHDLQRLTHIMVGDQNANAARFEVGNKTADIVDCNRVNAREGLIQQHIARI